MKLHASGAVVLRTPSERAADPREHQNGNDYTFRFPELKELISRVEGRVTKNIELEDIMTLTKLAVRLGFGATLGFVRDNQTNSLLKDRYREFAIDTLNYIATGQRSYSLHTWRALLGQSTDYGEAIWGDEHTGWISEENILPAVKLNRDHSTYASQWLSYEDGFEDMMYSLAILFGDHCDLPD
jgi:hypothetical protein